MATRTTYKRLDILDPDPTAPGAVMIQDNMKKIDDVIAGIPSGGTTGQVLVKSSGTDYDTEWTDATDGTTYTAGTGITISGTTISVTSGTYAADNHTHAYSDLTETPTIPTVPTTVSSFTNDAGYLTAHQSLAGKADVATTIAGYGITDAYTKTEIDAKVASVYKFKGNIASYSNLPSTGQITGDTYNVNDTGANYAWNGSSWDKLSETIDLTSYATTASVTSGLAGKANTSHTHSASDITSGTLANARIPTATSSAIGGVKVGSNLSISNGVLSATNTTYNAATTTTAGLLSASDKAKLDGITTSADAVSFTRTQTTGTKIGTLTINGTGTDLYAPAGTGETGGATSLSELTDVSLNSPTQGDYLYHNGESWINDKAITKCSEAFSSYWDGTQTLEQYPGSAPYPAELSHYAKYAQVAESVQTLPKATTTAIGGVKIGNGLTITADGLLSATATGGSGGSERCYDSFYYADENGNTFYHNTSDSGAEIPVELAHKAGAAYYAYVASSAENAGYASQAEMAMVAYCASCAEYASWAGPCYGDWDTSTSNVTYSASKAVLYESNANQPNTSQKICPLPQIGPFIVDVMIAWVENGTAHTAKYLISGNNLYIDDIILLTPSSPFRNVSSCSSNYGNFTVSSSALYITRRYNDVSCVYNCVTSCWEYICTDVSYNITTTATLCGRLIGNVS